jgi:hypothetical protein
MALYGLEVDDVNLRSRVVKSSERHRGAVGELYLYIYGDAKLPPVGVLPQWQSGEICD